VDDRQVCPADLPLGRRPQHSSWPTRPARSRAARHGRARELDALATTARPHAALDGDVARTISPDGRESISIFPKSSK